MMRRRTRPGQMSEHQVQIIAAALGTPDEPILGVGSPGAIAVTTTSLVTMSVKVSAMKELADVLERAKAGAP